MFDTISSDAKRLLITLYREYISRMKSGQDITSATFFGRSQDIKNHCLSDEPLANVEHWCRELSREKYLSCFFADNTAYEISLTDKTIRECEDRFKGKLVEIAKFLSNFIP